MHPPRDLRRLTKLLFGVGGLRCRTLIAASYTYTQTRDDWGFDEENDRYAGAALCVAISPGVFIVSI